MSEKGKNYSFYCALWEILCTYLHLRHKNYAIMNIGWHNTYIILKIRKAMFLLIF